MVGVSAAMIISPLLLFEGVSQKVFNYYDNITNSINSLTQFNEEKIIGELLIDENDKNDENNENN